MGISRIKASHFLPPRTTNSKPHTQSLPMVFVGNFGHCSLSIWESIIPCDCSIDDALECCHLLIRNRPICNHCASGVGPHDPAFYVICPEAQWIFRLHMVRSNLYPLSRHPRVSSILDISGHWDSQENLRNRDESEQQTWWNHISCPLKGP